MTDGQSSQSDTERYCGDCDIIVYDIPITDGQGSGYYNPDYCPKCGKPLHDDWVKCHECGGIIDFKKAIPFAKTPNDELFWHDDCAPEIQSVPPDTEQESNNG